MTSNQNTKTIPPHVEQGGTMLKIMSNPQRLMVLYYLLDSERNIQELSDLTGLSPTILAVHLNKMRIGGMVDFTRFHRVVQYRLLPGTAYDLVAAVYQLHFPEGLILN